MTYRSLNQHMIEVIKTCIFSSHLYFASGNTRYYEKDLTY